MIEHESIAKALYEAWRFGNAAPMPSMEAPGLDEAGAYLVQRAYVNLRLADDRVAGFKVGATAEPMRVALGLDRPLTGVLLASGAVEPGALVPVTDFRRLLIETEVAFRAAAAIDAPVADVETLQGAFPGCLPAFELAETGFFGAGRSAGVDLISANAACGRFVPGPACSSLAVDPEQVTVVLYRDDDLVYEAAASETLHGSPWQSLLWLVNRMVEQGYRIEPGAIFLTGALGPPQPAAAGRYRAEFGPLGVVEFDLTP